MTTGETRQAPQRPTPIPRRLNTMVQAKAQQRQVSLTRLRLLGTTALLPATLLLAAVPARAQAPNAAPTGGQVVAGQASIAQSAATTRITQTTNRAAIDWQTFNVGRNHTVVFNQPSASSWTLNRVLTPDPSMIAGRITANGGIAIVNTSGIVFAEGAQVNVGSLIASAANITNANFMAGRMVFDGAPKPGARVENRGQITVAERGLAALVAPGVANSGIIRARLGRVALAGAETYTLDLAGDGLVAIDVTQAVRQAPEGATALVTNSGVVEAQGGAVLLSADAAQGLVEAVVRNTGRVSADSAGTGRAGQVALRGRGGDVRVEAGGQVTARGTEAGIHGGTVEVSSRGGAAVVAEGARVSASGQGGGGRVMVGGAEARAAVVRGRVAARGTGAGARGGRVEVNAAGTVTVGGKARVNASGTAGGGTALIGTTGVGRTQRMAATTRVEKGAEIRADATKAGQGGTIAVNSTGQTEMRGLLSARGGAAGGDGGFVEVSGQSGLIIAGRVDVGADAGKAGTLLIDPENIRVVTDAEVPDPLDPGDEASSGPAATFVATSGPGGTLYVRNSDVNNFDGTVLLEAADTITIDAPITKGVAGIGAAGGLSIVAGGGGLDGTVQVNQAITVSGDITISTGTLTTGAAGSLTAVGGNRLITLGVDSAITLGADVSASMVEIRPLTDGRAVTLGDSATPSGLHIDSASLRHVQTGGGVLRIGSEAGGTGAITVAGDVLLRGAGNGDAASLELFGTNVQQTGGMVDVAAVSGRAMDPGPSAFLLDLTSAGSAVNRIDRVGAVNAQTIRITSADALEVTGTVAGGTVSLASAGVLTVTDPGKVEATTQANLYGSSLVLNGQVSGGTQGVTLVASGGTLDLDAVHHAILAGTVDPSATITQNDKGTIIGALTIHALGAVDLTAAPNQVSGLAALSSGDLSLASISDMTVIAAAQPGAPSPLTGVEYTPSQVRALGNLDLTAQSLTIDADTVSAGAGSMVRLVATAGDINLTGGQVAASGAGGTINLDAAGSITQTGGIIEADSLLVTAAAGSVSLDAADNQVGTLAGSADAGDFAFRNAGNLTIGSIDGTDGINATAGSVAITTVAAGDIAVNASVWGETGVSLSAAGGIAVATEGALLASDGPVLAVAAGGLTNDGLIVSNDLAGGIVAGATVDNSGLIVLGDAGSVLATAGALTNTGTGIIRTGMAAAATDLTNGPDAALLAADTGAGSVLAGARLDNAGTLISRGTVGAGTGIDNSGVLGARALTSLPVTNTGTVHLSEGITSAATIIVMGDLELPFIRTTDPAADIVIGVDASVSGGSGIDFVDGAGPDYSFTILSGDARTLQLDAGRDVVVFGTAQADSALTVTAGRHLGNAGSMQADSVLTITAGWDVGNAGSMQAGSALTVTAGQDILGIDGSFVVSTADAAVDAALTLDAVRNVILSGSTTVTSGGASDGDILIAARGGTGILLSNLTSVTAGGDGTVTLIASTGGIVQEASTTIDAARLRAVAGNGIDLGSRSNRIGTAAAWASAGDINLASTQTLTVGSVTSRDDAVGTPGTTANVEAEAGSVTLISDQDLRLEHSVIAGDAVLLQGQDIVVNPDGGGGTQSHSGFRAWVLARTGTVALQASGSVVNNGQIVALAEPLLSYVQASEDITNTGLISLGREAGDLQADGEVTNQGLIIARDVTAFGNLTNAAGGTIVALDITSHAGISNAGALFAGSAGTSGTVQARDGLENLAAGSIAAGGVVVTAGTLWNAGTIRTHSAEATGNIVNRSGAVLREALDPATVTVAGLPAGTDALDRARAGEAPEAATVTPATAGGGGLYLDAGQDVLNDGLIRATGGLQVLAAGNLENGTDPAQPQQGAWILSTEGPVIATAAGMLTNRGQIYTDPALDTSLSLVEGGTGLVNSGLIALEPMSGCSTVYALSGELTNTASGRILAGLVEAQAGNLDNAGGIAAGRATAGGDLLNRGGIIAAPMVEATGDVVNAEAAIITAGTAFALPGAAALEASHAVNGGTYTVQLESSGASGADLTVQAGHHLLTAGTIESLAGDVTLEAMTGAILQSGGRIGAMGGGLTDATAAGTLTLRAAPDAAASADPAAGHVWQTGGTILAGRVTGSAGRSIHLGREANSIGAVGDLHAGTATGLEPGADGLAPDAALVLRTSRDLLTVDGRVSAGLSSDGTAVRVTGGTIMLRADDMEIGAGGQLRTALGAVLLAPHTDGRGVMLGGTATGMLSLENAELGRISTADAGAAMPGHGILVIGTGGTGSVELAGDLDLRPGAGAGVAGLRIDSGADVVQTGGRLDVGQLNVQAPNGSVTLRSTGNTVDEVAQLRTVVAGTGAGQVLREGDGPADPLRFAVAAPTVEAHAPASGVTAGDDASLTVANAASVPLVVSGDMVVGSGRSLTLRADSLDLRARLMAPAGSIELRPFTAGREVRLGGGSDAPDALTLTTEELNRLGGAGSGPDYAPAAMLRIGRTASPMTGETNQTAGDILLHGDVLLRDGTGPGQVRVEALELFAGVEGGTTGRIVQSAGRLDVGALAGEARMEVALTGTENRIDRLAKRTDLGTVSFRSGAAGTANDGFSLVTTSRAADFTIEGSVIASGAGANLAIEEQGGALTVNGPGTWVLAEAGTVTLQAAGLLTNRGQIHAGLDRPGSLVSGGAGLVNSGLIALASNDVADSIVQATGGDLLNETGGGIVAGLVQVQAGSIINDGGIAAGVVAAAGDVSNSGAIMAHVAIPALPSASERHVDAIAGNPYAPMIGTGGIGNLVVQAGRDVQNDGTITAAQGLRVEAGRHVQGGNSSLFQAGDPGVVAGDLLLHAGATDPAGSIVLRGAARVAALSAGDEDGVVTLRAAGDLRQVQANGAPIPATAIGHDGAPLPDPAADVGGSIATAQLRLQAGGGIDLRAAANAIGTVAGQAGSALALRNAQSLTVGQVQSRDIAGHPVAIDGETASSGLHANTGSVMLDLRGAGSALTVNHDVVAGAGLLLATENGAITLAPAAAPGSPEPQLQAGADLRIVAKGAGSHLDASRVTADAAGEMALLADGDLAITEATLRSRRALLLSAGGNLTATGLAAEANDVMTFVAPGDIAVTRLTAQSGHAMTLWAGGDLTVTQGTARAEGTMMLSAAGRLRLEGGSYDAATLLVTAGRPEDQGSTVAVSGTAFTIGTAALFAARGGVDAVNGTTIASRAADRFPLVIFDTRGVASALRSLPDSINADTIDRAGLDPLQQTWQVRSHDTDRPGKLLFGRDDGPVPTPATGAAAGDVRLDLDAGGSPVFLLLDGGTAIGRLDAGRLGVHGQPGAGHMPGGQVVDLTGTLRGVPGGIAAQYGRITATQPRNQSLYRFNSCVIGSINCVVIPVAQPLPVPLKNDITVRSDDDSLDPDVLLPNISEEDY